MTPPLANANRVEQGRVFRAPEENQLFEVDPLKVRRHASELKIGKQRESTSFGGSTYAVVPIVLSWNETALSPLRDRVLQALRLPRRRAKLVHRATFSDASIPQLSLCSAFRSFFTRRCKRAGTCILREHFVLNILRRFMTAFCELLQNFLDPNKTIS